ncbi:SAM-dependent methyltransferase [Sorangium cellulosum]|uniref:SAM-dependent methyltransferase n=1 Tax=Sorangium cellulosum TaxID=56 RepID=UPI001F1F4CD9|nr:SAM-dependent methyltransferase [Sorangium cellulosum]
MVGTGIQVGEQTTLGAKETIEKAQKVFYAVADRAAAQWILGLNATAEALSYDMTLPRRRTVYEGMVDRIAAEVRKGLDVCAVFYGHPGVFAHATHKAIKILRQEGFPARMLPGVSAEDCLIADLGVDPGPLGCQSYEATDFLIRPRRFDPTTAMILWQVHSIGNLGFWDDHTDRRPALEILVEVLVPSYGPEHRVYVYEASIDPAKLPRIEPVLLAKLPEAKLSPFSTLFVPAKKAAELDPIMMKRLGVSFDS